VEKVHEFVQLPQVWLPPAEVSKLVGEVADLGEKPKALQTDRFDHERSEGEPYPTAKNDKAIHVPQVFKHCKYSLA